MPEQAAAPGMFASLLPILGVFLIFYLLVFRPQIRAQKAHAQTLKDLKKHDEVVTRGGLIGTIVNLKDDVVTLKLGDTTRVDVERSAIDRIYKAREAAKEGQSN